MVEINLGHLGRQVLDSLVRLQVAQCRSASPRACLARSLERWLLSPGSLQLGPSLLLGHCHPQGRAGARRRHDGAQVATPSPGLQGSPQGRQANLMRSPPCGIGRFVRADYSLLVCLDERQDVLGES
eukprot:307175-Hanusia_phi.AAC.5